MYDLFTTEDVLLLVSETIQTSHSDLNLENDLVLTHNVFVSSFVANIANFKHPLFATIPFWTNFYIRGSLLFFTLVLNILVIRFYSNGKGSTRSNILALSYIDVLLAVISSLAFLLQLVVVDKLLFNVISVVQYSIENVVFSNYLYPSLFLAVDRFIAVSFPHKVLGLSRKIRPIKFVFVVLNILVVTAMILMRLVAFPGSEIALSAFNLARLLFLCVQLFGTLALYSTIVVLLIRSNKALRHATHG